jgi:Na+/melibiose symporter-like transporter
VDPSVIPDLLSDEYEYIAGTAAQANEDRGKVTSFYIISVGSVVAAILGAPQISNAAGIQTNWAFFILFALLGVIGFLTLLQLIRLRGAWFDSAAAMGQIKEYYIEHFPEANLEKAFLWRAHSLPKRYKPGSMHFYQALQVELLVGLMVGAAIYFVGQAVGAAKPWMWPTIGGVISLVFQMYLYRHLLRKKPSEDSSSGDED